MNNEPLTIDMLRKIRNILEKPSKPYVDISLAKSNKLEKTLDQRVFEADKIRKKWERK